MVAAKIEYTNKICRDNVSLGLAGADAGYCEAGAGSCYWAQSIART